MKTFGTLEYSAKFNRFHVKCEPHVSIRLKRVFGKLGVGSMGTHSFHCSPENARDLLWFADRYPLEFINGTREKIEELSDEHKSTEQFIHEFYTNNHVSLPFDLAVPAREYQKQAADLFLKVRGLLLADDVGLGKTVSGIAALTAKGTLPCVVVTLAHLPTQWQREVNRFAPHLKTHIIKQTTPYKLSDIFGMPDVIIINYHKLHGWAETFAGFAKTVIFDEIQELRRNESAKYRAAEHLAQAAEFRLGLSATPIFNYGGEFFNVLDILRPGELGDPAEFYREWCTWGFAGKERIKEPKAFGRYITDAGMMLRRTRKDVAREIPAISKFHQEIDADTAALDQVSKSCAELAEYILRGQQVNKGDKMRASEELSNLLRQATGVAKAPHVANFVKMLLDNGEKVVLYGWHRTVYEIWLDMLKEYRPVMYTGSETAKQKDENKEKFMNGDAQVLIISLRAGAGLDGLQYACKTVVFGELDWSPGVHEQAIGRVARDGQEDPVMAYFLIADSGSDPAVVDVLGIKKGQIEGVRNHDAPLVEKLQIDKDHVKRLAESYLAQQGK